MEARARIEEDLFTRVPLTKQERKRQNATTRNISSITAIGDFGDDVADLVERAQELDDVPSNDRKRRLVDVVQDGNRSIPIGMKSGRRYTGEEDVPLRDTLGVRFFSLFVLRRNFSSLFLEIRHHHIEASISLPRDLSLSNLVLK